MLQPRLSSNTPFLPCEEGTHYHRGNHEDHVECLIAESVLVKFWDERASDIERKNIENSCASLMPKLRSKIFRDQNYGRESSIYLFGGMHELLLNFVSPDLSQLICQSSISL